uniref:Uncharacterized protein n=1 Tax=Arundo donax TaxID=35708 RepID=A0A0A9HV45_ARUDO
MPAGEVYCYCPKKGKSKIVNSSTLIWTIEHNAEKYEEKEI